MKIWEIDLEQGKKYKCNNGGTWETINGIFIETNGFWDITDYFKLRDLLQLEFEEVIDWSKVEKDTPVLVRNSENNSWILRHFDSCEVSPSGKSAIYRVFKSGRTSFTIQQVNQGEQKYEYYSQIKLYKGGKVNE